MRYPKRKRKKRKEDRISSIPPVVPPSNSVGDNPIGLRNAARLHEETKHKLTKPKDRTIFTSLVAGFTVTQIAGEFGWSLSWVLERVNYIDGIVRTVRDELQI